MLRLLILPLFAVFFGTTNLCAQQNAPRPTMQSLRAEDAFLQRRINEVTAFAEHLTSLKAAYQQNDARVVNAERVYLMNAMRREIDLMDQKALAEAARAERRKSASSGQLTQAVKTKEAVPKRDLFAEATTPTEINLEKMQYILAAFDRQSFDPSQPEKAAQDFAKLDEFLKIVQDDFAALKRARE